MNTEARQETVSITIDIPKERFAKALKLLAWLEIEDESVIKDLFERVIDGLEFDEDEGHLLNSWAYRDRATAERIAQKVFMERPTYQDVDLYLQEDGKTKLTKIRNPDFKQNLELWAAGRHPKQLAGAAA